MVSNVLCVSVCVGKSGGKELSEVSRSGNKCLFMVIWTVILYISLRY